MQIDSVSQFDFNTIVIFDKFLLHLMYILTRVLKNEQTNCYLHSWNI